MIEIFIKQFEQFITKDRISGVDNHEDQLTALFLDIVDLIGQDYATYYRYFPIFVSILDKHGMTAVLYATKSYENLFFDFHKELKTKPFDQRLIDMETDVSISRRADEELRRVLSIGNPVRISEDPFNFDFFTAREKELAAAAYIHALEERISDMNWEDVDFETSHLLLLPLHQLLKEIGQIEMFYFNVSSLLDKFFFAENFQASRNLLEEVIKTSFRDNEVELGFLVAFRVYSLGNNAPSALCAGCVSMVRSLAAHKDISEKHLSQLFIQTVKFFRNIDLFNQAIRFYEDRPKNLVLSAYEKRTLDYIYYSLLLKMKDERLPSLLLDYLNAEREVILASGKREATPWLVLLFQIRLRFPNGDYSPTGLGFYITVFEAIVPPDDIKKQRDIIFAESKEIKMHLKRSIVKLNATLYKSDFVYDNERALMYSNRCMLYSNNSNDVSGFLLAMILKSDYSLLFQSKDVEEAVLFSLPNMNLDELDAYDDALVLASRLPGAAEGLMWIGLAERNLYQLSYTQREYFFHTPQAWDGALLADLRRTAYFAQLSFDDSIKERGQVRMMFAEDYQLSTESIINKLSFAELTLPQNMTAVSLIKDMELSFFPHNLFMAAGGQFISETLPVTNVLSTEWIRSRSKCVLSADFSKAAWIPTESHDLTIQMLYSYMENVLQTNGFFVAEKIRPEQPLCADLNIICAHGADDISELQVFHFEDKLTLNLETLVGPGKVLILLVCHSGSAVKPMFRNETANLVMRFIAAGYEAVIAPAWALHIKIPPIWLPEFLNKLNEGEPINVAVFSANKKVREQYPTPAAWANLHLYGNPLVSL